MRPATGLFFPNRRWPSPGRDRPHYCLAASLGGRRLRVDAASRGAVNAPRNAAQRPCRLLFKRHARHGIGARQPSPLVVRDSVVRPRRRHRAGSPDPAHARPPPARQPPGRQTPPRPGSSATVSALPPSCAASERAPSRMAQACRRARNSFFIHICSELGCGSELGCRPRIQKEAG